MTMRAAGIQKGTLGIELETDVRAHTSAWQTTAGNNTISGKLQGRQKWCFTKKKEGHKISYFFYAGMEKQLLSIKLRNPG